MSKIFEALKRGEGEAVETVLNALQETPAVPAGPQTAPATEPRAPSMSPQALLEQLPEGASAEELQEAMRARKVTRVREPERVLPLQVVDTSPLLPFDSQNWRTSEQYRIIRTKIVQHPARPRMLLMTSAGPSDGKTVTAINLAGALSLKTDANVLLLDGDMRRSAVHFQLSLPREPGLADLLLDQTTLEGALIRAEQFPNLYIMPAGSSRVNPSDLLESARWRSLCAQLREQFRYIIVDSPPIAAVAEYDLLQAACDGVVLVARPDHTNLQQFLKGVGAVPKEKLIGVVMNCVSDWFLSRRANGDYGYYSVAEDAKKR